MEGILEKYKTKRVRDSTYKNYIAIWCMFNKFLIRLDNRPNLWEDRAALYCAYLIKCGNKSSTIKSYVSAIKAILRDDDYIWNENLLLINSLTRACRIVNDKVKCRLPIQFKLLELIPV